MTSKTRQFADGTITDALTTTTNTLNTTTNTLNTTTNSLTTTTNTLNDAVIATPTTALLNLGYGIQVATLNKVVPYNVLNIPGRTLVNLLGRDGNCEDTSKWSGYQATLTLDATNKTVGSSGLKCTIDTGYTLGLATHAYYTMQAGRYYIALADIKNGNANGGCNIRTEEGANNSTTITDTTRFYTSSMKFAYASDSSHRIEFILTGAAGQYAYVDSIRMYEVSLTEYNAHDALTEIQKAAKYPYVDDIKHGNAPYIIRYGENLLPTFNEWSLDSRTIVITSYSLTLVNTATGQNSYIDMPIVPNTNYTLSGTVTGGTSLTGGYLTIGWLDASGSTISYTATIFTGGSAITVLSPNNAVKARILCAVDGNVGTYTFTNPRLNIGTVDKGFKSRNDDYLYFPNIALASDVYGTTYDQLFSRDGKFFRENRFVRDYIVDGSGSWAYAVDLTGSKRFSVLVNAGLVSNSTSVATYCTKFDGKNLVPDGGGTVQDSFLVYNVDGKIYIVAYDVDTGFGETYSPSSAEISAYFYGYKMNNGTFGTPYNGTGTKTWTLWNATSNTNSVTAAPTTLATGFTPYKITYQLATSTLEEIVNEGSISTLEGSNQFEVGNGMIVREKANPASNGGSNYVINQSSVATSQLSKRAGRILAVYKNGKIDGSWIIRGQVPGATYQYGNADAYTPSLTLYDPAALYEVTYLALDQYALSANVQTINGEYDTNVKMVVDRLAQNQADISTRLSVVENNKVRKVQGQWIDMTLLSGWVNNGGGYNNAGYMKDDMGFTHLRGAIKSGTFNAATANLPIGFGPSASEVDFPTLSFDGTNFIVGKVTFYGDGMQIKGGNGQFISLDGISFQARL